MVILDSTIVYTAIPSIEADLDFSPGAVQWVITAYMVAFGGLLLFCGRAADLLGRRRVFMVGIALFGASSLVCGLAWSDWALITARGVQGLSAAIMAPAALSLVMTTFGEGAERNRALGAWGGIGGVGATAGLLVGGVITFWLGWEWIFFVNLPVSAVMLALSPVLLRESRDHATARTFDLAGAVTVTAAITLLVYAIVEVPEVGWANPRTLGLLAIGIVLVGLFLVIEARSAAPLVPLRVFRLRTLAGGNLVLLFVGMVADGMLFVLTLYAQNILGYSALQFGLMAAVMTVMSIVGAMVGQAFVTRVGMRPVASAGTALLGAGCLLLTWVSVDGSYLSDMFVGLLVFGTGLGAAFVAAQIAALTDIAEEDSGLASGLADTSFNIGSALGIAVAAAVAFAHTDRLLVGGAQLAVAQTTGFQLAFGAALGFALIGLLAALLLLGRPRRDRGTVFRGRA